MNKNSRKWILVSLAVLLLGWLFCLPRNLFKDIPCSTVVYSAEGELLGARIADDQQWRFPPCDTVPSRYAKAVVRFEDRHFYWHPGVNPVSLVRALIDNIRSGHVVSGGSTLTMQVVRLSRQRERTVWQKMIEAVLATRMEFRYTKREILALYASYAPFGGNVVGLEAASWRYFGRPAGELSWGEAATLAVLPNAPASMHPGRNRDALLEKRNRLLAGLLEHGDIDQDSYEAALSEPLPDAPLPLPSYAPHFVESCPRGVQTHSTLKYSLQRAVETAVNRKSDEMAREGVADMAAVVIDNTSGAVVAYVGNASPDRERPGVSVDIASSPRSTGSILKPFLYAAALQDGVILPETLLPDIPVNLGGFAPQNFDRQFYGAVHASEALARSLNVPAVFLLRSYGVPRFHELLQRCGLSTLSKDASYYGLSLILGGGEGRLDEITKAYAGLVRTYMRWPVGAGHDGRVTPGRDDHVTPSRDKHVTPSRDKHVTPGRDKHVTPGRDKHVTPGLTGGLPITDKTALWYTFEALKEVNRPDELDWRLISSVRKAAWKTGTSYGFRDAWAVGMTPDYTIGVWAGNAEGQGVPGLTGARAAGPVMFDILNLLPESGRWFPETEDGVWVQVCPESGMLAGPDCPNPQDMLIPSAGLESEPCPYHADGVFTLTPAMEWYYKPHHPEYTGASVARSTALLEFIYPSGGTTLYLPRQLDGKVEGAVFRLAHRKADATVFWHLDQTYVGETRFIHEMRLSPAPGRHVVTCVDNEGNSVSVGFTVGEN